MEDRRTALAIFLCIATMLLYSELVISPYMRQGEPVSGNQQHQQVQHNPPNQVISSPPNQVQISSGTPGPNQVSQTQDPSIPTPAEFNEAGVMIIESNKVLVRISSLGARLTSYRLKDYRKVYGGEELLDLIETKEGTGFPLGVYVGGISDAAVRYKAVTVVGGVATKTNGNESGYLVPPEGELTIKFEGELPFGAKITKTFRFGWNSYLFGVEVKLSKPAADASPVWLEWLHHIPLAALHARYDPYFMTLLDSVNKVSTVDASTLPDGKIENGGENVWASFGDKYFMSTLIPSQRGTNTALGKFSDVYLMRAGASQDGGQFTIYAGPKDYRVLRSTGYDLHRNIDLGWFSFLAYPLLWSIRFFQEFLGNYGLAIILLTLIIKTLMLPLNQASFRSMKAMQDIQPEMKALRERIKDTQQLNQELMALYKKRGVNPMGGCLPMLIQLPVFLGLYNAFLGSIELRHAPFALWVHDLSAPEAFHIFGIPVPVMLLLMAASMFVQQWMTPSSMDPQQKKVMMMMPLMFVVMFIVVPMPAGLVLYWLVNNLISITQQAYIRSDKNANALIGTLVVGTLIFCVGYVLTLI